MGIEPIRAVLGDRRKGIAGAPVRGAGLLVLLSHAERASRRNDWEVWSSAADTAWRVGLSERQVRRSNRELCNANLLEPRGVTAQGVPVYRVCWERLLPGPDFLSGGDEVSGEDDHESAGDERLSGGGDEVSVAPDEVSSEPEVSRKEPVSNPKGNAHAPEIPIDLEAESQRLETLRSQIVGHKWDAIRAEKAKFRRLAEDAAKLRLREVDDPGAIGLELLVLESEVAA